MLVASFLIPILNTDSGRGWGTAEYAKHAKTRPMTCCKCPKAQVQRIVAERGRYANG